MNTKEPCIGCPDKNIDKWGYFCDVHCGKRSAWLNYQGGIKEVVEWGKETCPHCIGTTYHYKRVCDTCWQNKFKEWGIE